MVITIVSTFFRPCYIQKLISVSIDTQILVFNKNVCQIGKDSTIQYQNVGKKMKA